MFKNRIKLKRDREGAVLAFVLIIFLVVSIILSSVIYIFSSNLKLSKHQEENMRAHYLALSGIDVTLSTLLSTLNVEDGEDKTMADKFFKDNKDVTLSDEIEIEGDKVYITVVFVKDTREITINASTTLESGYSKQLSLNLEYSGDKFKKRWS